jgi:hypothetical protein
VVVSPKKIELIHAYLEASKATIHLFMITLISPYIVRWMLVVDPRYYPLHLVIRLTLPIILPIFVPECPLAMEQKIFKMVSRHVISMLPTLPLLSLLASPIQQQPIIP